MIEQPFDRPRGAPGEAVLDLKLLLGHMNMDRRRAVAGVERRHRLAEKLGRHRPQAVQGDADTHIRVVAITRQQAVDQGHEIIRPMEETALAGAGLGAAETAMGVEHGQMGDADSRRFGRRDQPMGHFPRVVVGRAVRAVVQVMELADRRIAGFEHLHVELGGDGLHMVRREPLDEAVHDLAPAPETVAAGSGALGEAGHGALEGMAVQVRHAGNHRAGQAHRVARLGVRRHRRQISVGGHRHADVAGPAVRQQGALGEIATHGMALSRARAAPASRLA